MIEWRRGPVNPDEEFAASEAELATFVETQLHGTASGYLFGEADMETELMLDEYMDTEKIAAMMRLGMQFSSPDQNLTHTEVETAAGLWVNIRDLSDRKGTPGYLIALCGVSPKLFEIDGDEVRTVWGVAISEGHLTPVVVDLIGETHPYPQPSSLHK